jgi:hypothetical protein
MIPKIENNGGKVNMYQWLGLPLPMNGEDHP